jgi:mannose-6-phosphate isomerase-like protein (cupin superfamily)
MTAHDHHAPSSDSDAHVSVVGPGGGRVVELGSLRMTVKEDGSRTRGTLAVLEFEAPGPFPSPVPHIHRNHEEGFYVLEGELEFTVGSETIAAPAGTFVMVPIGVPHSFRNAGSGRVRFLGTMSPDFYVHYFEEIAPLFASGHPDPKAVGQIMARYQTDTIRSS